MAQLSFKFNGIFEQDIVVEGKHVSLGARCQQQATGEAPKDAFFVVREDELVPVFVAPIGRSAVGDPKGLMEYPYNQLLQALIRLTGAVLIGKRHKRLNVHVIYMEPAFLHEVPNRPELLFVDDLFVALEETAD